MNLLYTTLTIGLVIAGIVFVLALLPTAGTLPTEFTTSVTSMIGYVAAWGFIVDFETLFRILGLILRIEGALIVVQIGMWVINKVVIRKN